MREPTIVLIHNDKPVYIPTGLYESGDLAAIREYCGPNVSLDRSLMIDPSSDYPGEHGPDPFYVEPWASFVLRLGAIGAIVAVIGLVWWILE